MLHVFYIIHSILYLPRFLLRWSHLWLKWLMVHLPAYEMKSGVRSFGKFVRFVEFGPVLKARRCLVMLLSCRCLRDWICFCAFSNVEAFGAWMHALIFSTYFCTGIGLSAYASPFHLRHRPFQDSNGQGTSTATCSLVLSGSMKLSLVKLDINCFCFIQLKVILIPLTGIAPLSLPMCCMLKDMQEALLEPRLER